MTQELLRHGWPLDRLGEAVEALALRSKMPIDSLELPPSPNLWGTSQEDRNRRLGDWLNGVAVGRGIEIEPVETTYTELPALVRGAGPSIAVLNRGKNAYLLLLLGQRRHKAMLLCPDRRVRRVPVELLVAALGRDATAPLIAEVDQLLERAQVPHSSRDRARQSILRERLNNQVIGGCWMLRISPAIGLWRQILLSRLIRRLALFFGAHITSYLLMLIAWVMIGQTALTGHIDQQWLIAWFLILIEIFPPLPR